MNLSSMKEKFSPSGVLSSSIRKMNLKTLSERVSLPDLGDRVKFGEALDSIGEKMRFNDLVDNIRLGERMEKASSSMSELGEKIRIGERMSKLGERFDSLGRKLSETSMSSKLEANTSSVKQNFTSFRNKAARALNSAVDSLGSTLLDTSDDSLAEVVHEVLETGDNGTFSPLNMSIESTGTNDARDMEASTGSGSNLTALVSQEETEEPLVTEADILEPPPAVHTHVYYDEQEEEELSAIANSIEEKYFDEGFDAVEGVMNRLGELLDEQLLDSEMRTKHRMMHAISVRLTNNLLESSEELVTGMLSISELEEELEVTAEKCRNGRRFLSAAERELHASGLSVLSKQNKRNMLADVTSLLQKIQPIIDAEMRLRSCIQSDDYERSVQLCLDLHAQLKTFSNIDSLRMLSNNVEDMLKAVEVRMEQSLIDQCLSFDPLAYSRILPAYDVLKRLQYVVFKLPEYFEDAVKRSARDAVLRHISARPPSNSNVWLVQSEVSGALWTADRGSGCKLRSKHGYRPC
mmetsp:Transcript_41464/g.67285  ORF Transcript_41464/g.67285 Transcript_41464/m.67285 type:complete len:521 (-) Transcript_41464:81-1643(-)